MSSEVQTIVQEGPEAQMLTKVPQNPIFSPEFQTKEPQTASNTLPPALVSFPALSSTLTAIEREGRRRDSSEYVTLTVGSFHVTISDDSNKIKKNVRLTVKVGYWREGIGLSGGELGVALPMMEMCPILVKSMICILHYGYRKQ